MAVKDWTRTDQRKECEPEPFWLSTKVIDHSEISGNTLIVLAFPKGAYMVHEVVVEEIEAVVGASLDVNITTTVAPLKLTSPQYTYEGVTLVSGDTKPILPGVWLSETTDDVVVTVQEDVSAAMTAGNFIMHVLMSKIPFRNI